MAEESDSPNIEVIIMLDTSESMEDSTDGSVNDSEDNSKIKLAKKWAQELCTLFVNTKITVSMCTFDNVNEEEMKIEKTKIDIKNAKENIDKLEEIDSKKLTYTDHYGALKKAENGFGQQADYKYIMILSDGETKYENDIRLDNKAENDLEKKMTTKEAKGFFQDRCESFASKENQGIFLIGFGEDIDMFQALNEKKHILYIDQSKEPSEITNKIFEELDMPLFLQEKNENKNRDKRNKIEFELEKEHYRTIINITREADLAESGIDPTQIKLYMEETGENEISQENFDILCLKNSAFLYLEPSKKGKYQIVLPEDIWYYEIRNQENGILKEVKLILEAENLQSAKLEDDIIQYDIKKQPKELVLRLEFVWDSAGEHKNPDSAILVNTSQKERTDDDWKKGRSISTDNWKYVLDTPKDDENNVYCVQVKNGNKTIYSNNIKIVRNWVVEKNKELQKNEEYDLKNAVPEEFTDNNDIEYEIQNENKYKKHITLTGDTIAFSKAGNYIVNIKYKSKLIGKVGFTVKRKCDMFILIVILLSIVIVLMIFVRLVTKRKN